MPCKLVKCVIKLYNKDEGMAKNSDCLAYMYVISTSIAFKVLILIKSLQKILYFQLDMLKFWGVYEYLAAEKIRKSIWKLVF